MAVDGQHCPLCGREYGIEVPFCEADLSELRPGAPVHVVPVEDTAIVSLPPARELDIGEPPVAARTTIDASDGPSRTLVIVGGSRFSINDGERLVLGRDPALPTAFALAPHDNVSRIHCSLELSGGRVTATDLGSSNGTFVDNARIAPHTPVEVGARSTVRLAADVPIEIVS